MVFIYSVRVDPVAQAQAEEEAPGSLSESELDQEQNFYNRAFSLPSKDRTGDLSIEQEISTEYIS